jgi:hypothetical protein
MIRLFSEALKKEWQLHLHEYFEDIIVDLLVALSYLFPEEKLKISNSPAQHPVRHFQSHNINATLLANTQRATHI